MDLDEFAKHCEQQCAGFTEWWQAYLHVVYPWQEFGRHYIVLGAALIDLLPEPARSVAKSLRGPSHTHSSSKVQTFSRTV